MFEVFPDSLKGFSEKSFFSFRKINIHMNAIISNFTLKTFRSWCSCIHSNNSRKFFIILGWVDNGENYWFILENVYLTILANILILNKVVISPNNLGCFSMKTIGELNIRNICVLWQIFNKLNIRAIVAEKEKNSI